MIARLAIACLPLAMIAADPAGAICSGASLEQEFREADVVVRARLVSELNVWDDEPSAAFRAQWGNFSPVVLYRLAVAETFKGRPGPRIRFFEERNSGAFYLDPDRDYLLFLTYNRPEPGRPAAARGAMYVRHACGQSKEWSEVPAEARARLRALAGPRRG